MREAEHYAFSFPPSQFCPPGLLEPRSAPAMYSLSHARASSSGATGASVKLPYSEVEQAETHRHPTTVCMVTMAVSSPWSAS